MEDITILTKEDKILLRRIKDLVSDVSRIKTKDRDYLEKRANHLLVRMHAWDVFLKT